MNTSARMRAGALDFKAVSCAPPKHGLGDLAPCGVVSAQKQDPEAVGWITSRRFHVTSLAAIIYGDGVLNGMLHMKPSLSR